MKGSSPHLSYGQLDRGSARCQAARGSVCLPRRTLIRWTRCAPRLAVSPLSRGRRVVWASSIGSQYSDGGDSTATGQQPGPQPAPANASRAPPRSPGRHWLGRAACCAVAAAVTLGALAGADVGAVAAATAAAAVQPGVALRPHGVPSELPVQRRPPPRHQAVLVFRGLALRAQPAAEPGAAAEEDASYDSASYDGAAGWPMAAPTRYDAQPVAQLAAADITGPDAPALSPALRFTLNVPGRQPGPGPQQLPPATLPLLRAVGGSTAGDSGGAVVGSEVASETEDRLLEVARQVEARVEGALGALTGGVPQLLRAGALEAEQDAFTSAAHALIREVWEVVDNYYLDARSTGFDRGRWGELRDAALAVSYRDTPAGYRAVRDMLARGLSDPYCRFIGPSELEAMKKYDVSGVGLNLGTAAEYVVKTGNDLPTTRSPAGGPSGGVFVVGVSKGSAADVAGVRQGDELIEIQGRSLADSTPFRAAGLISGTAEEEGAEGGLASAPSASSSSGSKAAADGDRTADVDASSSGQEVRSPQQLRVGVRKGDPIEDVVKVKVRHTSGEEQELSLLRPRRTLPSAVSTSLSRSSLQLPGGGRGDELVGSVRLTSFNARAQADVAAAIRQLEAAGATRLVLDLRDNRGGLVTEGLEVARLFLEGDAPIVITERRDAPPDTPRAPGPPLTSAPLLVLVNGHTASASEIVAGALHDNCRAVLAGSRTYGKGLIQSVYELSDGSGLVVTVGKYLTPRGTDIDRYGIKPDFNGVPSPAQYDSTIKACKLSGPAVAMAPPVYGDADADIDASALVAGPRNVNGGGGGEGASFALGGWRVFGGR